MRTIKSGVILFNLLLFELSSAASTGTVCNEGVVSGSNYRGTCVYTTLTTSATKATTATTSSSKSTETTSTGASKATSSGSKSRGTTSAGASKATSSILSCTTSTNALGLTVISDSNGQITLPTGLAKTRVLTTTFPDGKKTTINLSDIKISTTPSPAATTSINSLGFTIISNSNGKITLPTGLPTTKVLTTTFPDGKKTTISLFDIKVTHTSTTSTSSTSSSIIPLLFPITSSVAKPTAKNSQAVIPCSMWFFDLCLPGIDINGWRLDEPKGIHPPGPPPPIETINDHLTISIKGILPKWPQYTIGPGNVPTFSPKPSNCETQTAEVCITTTSFGLSTSKTATVTTTTHSTHTCATLTGCAVEAASSTATTTGVCSTATAGAYCMKNVTYVVYPRDGTNGPQVDAISADLQQYVYNASRYNAANTKTSGLLYWELPLNEITAAKVRSLPNVAGVGPSCNCAPDGSCNTCLDPSTAILWQPPIPYQDQIIDQSAFISWPAGADYVPESNYYFDESDGQDIPIYVLDTGLNRRNPEFTRLLADPNRLEWIYTGPDDFRSIDFPDDSQTPQDPLELDRNAFKTAHGTAMLSVIAGDSLGIAKSVKPILVRVPRRLKLGSGFTPEDWLMGLGKIVDDLHTRQPVSTAAGFQLKAVVLLASKFLMTSFLERDDGGDPIPDTESDIFRPWLSASKELIQKMETLGALVVTGSGNQVMTQWKDGWPANFAGRLESDPLQSLLVAGGVSTDGEVYPYAVSFEQGLPQVYGPGDQIWVADGFQRYINAGNIYRSTGGTSTAAAYTAGLAAYFVRMMALNRLPLKTGQTFPATPLGLKQYMIQRAAPRGANPPLDPIRRSIFNGIFSIDQENACQWNPNTSPPRIRRDTSSASCNKPKFLDYPLTCYAERAVSGGIDPDAQQSHAEGFCQTIAEKTGDWIYPPNQKQTIGFTKNDREEGVNYSYIVRWIDGCDGPGLNVTYPFGPVPGQLTHGAIPNDFVNSTCFDLMTNAYTNCKDNKGVGGYTQVGCLNYTFVGALGEAAPCPGCVDLSNL